MFHKVNFTLIKPPIPYHLDPTQQQPLGILYIASVLNKECNTRLLDLSNIKPSEAVELINESEIYGFSSSFLDLDIVCRIANYIKRKHEGIIVIGGPGPTFLPAVVKNNFIDSIVIGEGEKAILKLIHDYKKYGQTKEIYNEEPENNLDNIPFPARDLLETKGGKIFSFGKNYYSGVSTGIISSRGCIYKCAFCSRNLDSYSFIRYRNIENVVDEIIEVVKKFNIREFRFQDEVFSLNKDRTILLCEEMIRKKIKVYWRASTRADRVDGEILTAMKSAGCVEVNFGAETGDQKILNLLNKNLDVEDNIIATELANKLGLVTRLFMMVGLPGTSVKTPYKDILFLEKAKPKAINLAIYTPYPGSDIWQNPEKYGIEILSKDFSKYNMHFFSKQKRTLKSAISINGISSKELEKTKRIVFQWAKAKNLIHLVN